MLASFSQTPVAIVGLVFTFVYLMVRVTVKSTERRRRLDLIEKALESGAIDDATKRELLGIGGIGSIKANLPRIPPVFGFGWLGLFIGAGLLLIAEFGEADVWPAAVLTILISFGVVTMPLALRELQSRRA